MTATTLFCCSPFDLWFILLNKKIKTLSYRVLNLDASICQLLSGLSFPNKGSKSASVIVTFAVILRRKNTSIIIVIVVVFVVVVVAVVVVIIGVKA